MPFLSLSLVAVLTVVERPAGPVEQPLVTIISEPQSHREHQVSLVLEGDGSIVQVVRRSAGAHTVTSADQLIRGRVALAGHEAFLASCQGCDPQRGGRLLLEYLNNGVTGRYASRALRLEKFAGAFRLTTEDGAPIRRLRLTARRLLGVLVGIADVVAE